MVRRPSSSAYITGNARSIHAAATNTEGDSSPNNGISANFGKKKQLVRFDRENQESDPHSWSRSIVKRPAATKASPRRILLPSNEPPQAVQTTSTEAPGGCQQIVAVGCQRTQSPPMVVPTSREPLATTRVSVGGFDAGLSARRLAEYLESVAGLVRRCRVRTPPRRPAPTPTSSASSPPWTRSGQANRHAGEKSAPISLALLLSTPWNLYYKGSRRIPCRLMENGDPSRGG